MCFSAQASFTAATFLSISALLSISLSRKPWEYVFACTPLCFALQQFFEGLIWTGIASSDPRLAGHLMHVGTGGFLFFALIFWPLWIPFVVYKLEPNASRKKIMGYPLAAGGAVASLFIASLLQGPAETAAEGQHIVYTLTGYPNTWTIIIVSSLLYIIATILPPFISSLPGLWLFGLATAIAYVTTYYFYTQAFISVWCFFAAVISAIIPWVLCKWNCNSTKQASTQPKETAYDRNVL